MMHSKHCANTLHLAVVILALCCAVMAPAPLANAADTTITLKSVGYAPVDLNAPLGFAEAVKVALAQAESLRVTKVDIEVSKLGEKDTWYRMFPKLNLIANYSVPVIQEKKDGANYKESINLSFSTGSYDPISAYISHDASKISVKLSEMLHVIAIQEMLEKIGSAFIDIDAVAKEIETRKQLVEVMESLLAFTRSRYDAGSVSSLEYRMAEQRLALARLELSRSVRKREQILRDLKQLIGLDRRESVVFNTANSVEQFAPEENINQALKAETLIKRNLSIQAQVLREKLQKYNITQAQAEHVPKFSFGFRTPDPLSNQQGNLPYYANVETTVPLWAWGETMRGEEKARLKYQGVKLESRLLLNKVQQTADDLREAMEANTEAAALAQTKAELQQLEVVRKEINYKAGSLQYDALVSAQEAAIKAQLDAIRARKTLSEARLNMRVVTGSLINEYLRVDYGELENN